MKERSLNSLNQIKKVFIANRGEIASRIAKSCKDLNVKTVMFLEKKLHDKGLKPKFLDELIDEWAIVEEETTQLYLDMDRVIEIAKEHECDAIHPGFGFLSENAELVSVSVYLFFDIFRVIIVNIH